MENEAVLLCVTMREHTQAIFFDIPFAITKFSFCSAFSNAFWHGNDAFPKGSFQNETVPLLIIFHSSYRNEKMRFHSFCCENQNFSLLLHLCRLCNTRIVLVMHSSRLCLTRVTLVSVVSQSCCTRVWHSCCKIGQIETRQRL